MEWSRFSGEEGAEFPGVPPPLRVMASVCWRDRERRLLPPPLHCGGTCLFGKRSSDHPWDPLRAPWWTDPQGGAASEHDLASFLDDRQPPPAPLESTLSPEQERGVPHSTVGTQGPSRERLRDLLVTYAGSKILSAPKTPVCLAVLSFAGASPPLKAFLS